MHSESSREVVVNVIKLKDLIIEDRLNEASPGIAEFRKLKEIEKAINAYASEVSHFYQTLPQQNVIADTRQLAFHLRDVAREARQIAMKLGSQARGRGK